MAKHWRFLLLSAFAFAVFSAVFGFWDAREVRTVLLAPQLDSLPGPRAAADQWRLTPWTDALQTPLLYKRVAAALGITTSPDRLAASLSIDSSDETGIIRVVSESRHADEASRLANACAKEILVRIEEIRETEAAKRSGHSREKLAGVEQELADLHNQMEKLLKELGISDFEEAKARLTQQAADVGLKARTTRIELETLDLQIKDLASELARHSPAMLEAQEALNKALLRYTEEHPKVKQLRAAIESLTRQAAEGGIQTNLTFAANSLGQTLYSRILELKAQRVSLAKQAEEFLALERATESKLDRIIQSTLSYTRLKARAEALRRSRDVMLAAQQEARASSEQALPSYFILESANPDDSGPSRKMRAAVFAGLLGGSAGLVVSLVLVLLVEFMDDRIRNVNDLGRVTRVPVIGVLDNLHSIDAGAAEKWAFQALMLLKGRLQCPGSQPLVCGFTSARKGEGRSTLVRLLAGVAVKCGFRVVTVAANVPVRGPEPGDPEPEKRHPGVLSGQLVRAALEPSRLLSDLADPSGQPMLHIPLPDNIANPEQRDQWRKAIQSWKKIQDLVVLVDLPPASRPETVLLSENLPHLVWVCEKDATAASDAASHIEVLRSSGANLAGAFLNRVSSPAESHSFGIMKKLIPLSILVLAAHSAFAQDFQIVDPPGQPPPTNSSGGYFSITSPEQLAEWQQRLTLGSGDVIDIALYDQADTVRNGLVIGPDGRLNYLQARDVMAAGLTIDELRTKLEEILSRYYPSPSVIIIPRAYTSKRYYLLGNVGQRGVFVLDRPVTLLEAIARAGGLATSIQQRNSQVMVDFSRSFLVRKGPNGAFDRINVDFESLFLRGDLRHNIPLAPDDYLYFQPLEAQEVYVLGRVLGPGIVPYTSGLSVLRAIIARGGFAEDAYRTKVLVIRGSLTRPQTFIVDTAEILRAEAKDFRLEPRDIIYVHRKPWAKAQELLEFAVSDFMRAAIITWTGQHIGPWITDPLF